MLINVDVKSLEWCTYLFLSQDKVGIDEWHSVLDNPTKNDIHKDNQIKFSLPSRLIAKIFLFRWIYRGSAYAYSKDPDFTNISSDIDYWQSIIDSYYSKYSSIYIIHKKYIELAIRQGFIVSPFGRVHEFKPKQTYKGLVYNESDITNHPNQGLGADVVSMIRVLTKHKMDQSKVIKKSKLINTVHDSIVTDAPDEEIEPVVRLYSKIFQDVPKALSNYFSVNWNIPIKEEITVGHNMKELSEYIL